MVRVCLGNVGGEKDLMISIRVQSEVQEDRDKWKKGAFASFESCRHSASGVKGGRKHVKANPLLDTARCVVLKYV